jgi:hypothetical protein
MVLLIPPNGHGGSLLHQKEGHKAGLAQGGGIWGKEGKGSYQIMNQQTLQLWTVKLDIVIVKSNNQPKTIFLIHLLKVYIMKSVCS